MRAPEPNIYFPALGRYLRKLRVARGLSQAELGTALGVDCERVDAYEEGIWAHPSILVLWRLAQFYKMSMDDLVGMVKRAPGRKRLVPQASRFRARRLQTLSEADQRFVGAMMDAILSKNPAKSPREVIHPKIKFQRVKIRHAQRAARSRRRQGSENG